MPKCSLTVLLAYITSQIFTISHSIALLCFTWAGACCLFCHTYPIRMNFSVKWASLCSWCLLKRRGLRTGIWIVICLYCISVFWSSEHYQMKLCSHCHVWILICDCKYLHLECKLHSHLRDQIASFPWIYRMFEIICHHTPDNSLQGFIIINKITRWLTFDGNLFCMRGFHVDCNQ